jgi:hypothetical protein
MAKRNEKSQSLLKNHVSDLDTKTLQNVLKDRFGYSLEDFQAVLSGDREKAKEIAEFGKQGRIASKYAPRVAQAILDGIEGTKELNVQTANLLKAAGSANAAIEKAGQSTLLANQKYNNQKAENALDYSLANNQEKVRHDYAMTYIESKYFYDTYFLTIDADAKQLEQTNRPEMKQITEDERYEIAVLDHLLTHGEKSDTDLVVARDYQESSHKGSGILGTVKGFLGSIKSGAGW